jgi:hypothetical protein
MATYEEILRRIRGAESSNNPLAKAKTSSAGGLYQFTTGTISDVLKRMDPETYGGKSKAELAKFRFDPAVSEQAAHFHLNRDIIPKLEKSGVPVNPGSIYASWFLGPDGAVKTYQADPGAKVADVTPYAVEPNANIKFQGKKFGDWQASDLVNWAEKKMGYDPSTASAATAPRTPYEQPSPDSIGKSPMGQFVQDVLGGATFGAVGTKYPGQGTSSTAIPSLLGQATGGLLGQATVPSAMGIDTRKYGEVTEPGFSGAALPAQQEVASAATDMGFKDYAPSMGGAAGIGSALASLGGALAKAGAAKEDMSWVQRPAETHRGKWDDEIFKRSIFGIRGLLG